MIPNRPIASLGRAISVNRLVGMCGIIVNVGNVPGPQYDICAPENQADVQ
jgi:hypothetical protein